VEAHRDRDCPADPDQRADEDAYSYSDDHADSNRDIDPDASAGPDRDTNCPAHSHGSTGAVALADDGANADDTADPFGGLPAV
jgi:hypothetical protein